MAEPKPEKAETIENRKAIGNTGSTSNSETAEELDRIIRETRVLLDVMADAVCILDGERQVVYQNEAYGRMLKRSSTELVSDSRQIVEKGECIGTVVVYHDISEVNRLRNELDRLNRKLRKVQTKYNFKDIIGQDPAMLKVIDTAKVAAATPATIMIRGESGTGKEIFANAIHNSSPRRSEAFIKINCSSLPEELLESELFGYKDGAFTGAKRGGRKGLFQEADRGTLFLDEIGDVSLRMQAKLLRVLQEREVMPLGSSEAVPVDVRIICATHKPLEEMIARGDFREDLYYRLNVFPLFIPPLRQRKSDIGLIVEYLLNKYNEFYGRNVETVDPEAIGLLQERDWPGNVRELENVLSRALINLPEKEQHLKTEDIAAALGEESFARKAMDGKKVTAGGRAADGKTTADGTIAAAGMGSGAGDARYAGAEASAGDARYAGTGSGAGGTGAAGDGAQADGVRGGMFLAADLPENLTEAMAQCERALIRRALEKVDGDKNQAAVLLGLPLRTLYYKCKKLGI